MTKRGVGRSLIGLGLLALIAPVALVAWLHHFYTTGVSVKGQFGFVIVSILPLGCVAFGLLLLRRSKKTA